MKEKQQKVTERTANLNKTFVQKKQNRSFNSFFREEAKGYFYANNSDYLFVLKMNFIALSFMSGIEADSRIRRGETRPKIKYLEIPGLYVFILKKPNHQPPKNRYALYPERSIIFRAV